MIRAAYLDLGYADFCENYICNPIRYGGGRALAVALKKSDKIQCDVIAREEAFSVRSPFAADFFKTEDHPRNRFITQELQDAVRGGQFISLKENYDILIHHFTNVFVNTDVPQVVWPLGYGELVDYKHKYVAYYNTYQNVRCNGSPNFYRFVLGVNIPPFENVTKDDYIFQCTRHTPFFGSIEVARFALKYGVKTIFAGPIDNGYPLSNFIDNKTTFYLGQIPEQDKIHFTKHAKATTYLHTWKTPMNLSALQSIALGTPIIATQIGFWPSLVRKGINGFLVPDLSEDSVHAAYQQVNNINPFDCHTSVSEYSEEKMVDSFIKVCEDILSSENKQIWP